jgi:hypothetical protein
MIAKITPAKRPVPPPSVVAADSTPEAQEAARVKTDAEWADYQKALNEFEAGPANYDATNDAVVIEARAILARFRYLCGLKASLFVDNASGVPDAACRSIEHAIDVMCTGQGEGA